MWGSMQKICAHTFGFVVGVVVVVGVVLLRLSCSCCVVLGQIYCSQMLRTSMRSVTRFGDRLAKTGVVNMTPKALFSAGNVAVTDFSSVTEMQQKACKLFADRDMFGIRAGNKYEWMKYKEFDAQVQKFRNVLVNHHHIKKGDKVALISNNRIEWAVTKFALASIGAPLVPMYEAQLDKDWQYIIEDSGAKLIIAGTDAVYNRTKGFVSKVS
jgi:hypothetical protein